MPVETRVPRAGLSEFVREPFRVFFPLAVLAGMAGVALWPLHFLAGYGSYPGQIHARIMAFGFFGGFIFGFLGTAMPRMLSAPALVTGEVAVLLGSYLAMIGAYFAGQLALGDTLMACVLLAFLACMGSRASRRKDTPPPGFVLVGLSFLSVIVGVGIAVLQTFRELDLFWTNLQRLLCYQGFILLPILGVGPFIMPRFFGLQSAHDFPEMLAPTTAWKAKALRASTAGALILLSFVLEAAGWFRIAYTVRFMTVLAYMCLELLLGRAPKASNALGLAIRFGLISLVCGFLAVAFLPAYRLALLHLTFIGGFATITFIVATRVVFGHSGNIRSLKGRNRWLLITVGLMFFAMATRISGDFWPHIMASHYNYGAILWIVSVAIWSVYVLPKVLQVEAE